MGADSGWRPGASALVDDARIERSEAASMNTVLVEPPGATTIADSRAIRRTAPRFLRKSISAPQPQLAAVPGAGHDVAIPAPTISPARRRRGAIALTHLLNTRRWIFVLLASDLLTLGLAVATARVAAREELAAAALVELSVAFAPLSLVFLLAFGLYRARLRRSVLDEVLLAGAALSVAAMTLITTVSLSGAGSEATSLLAWTWALAVASVAGARAGLLSFQTWARANRRLAQRVLIVGTGEVAASLARRLRAHPEYGLLAVGVVESRPSVNGSHAELPIVGTTDALVEAAQRTEAERILLAFSEVPDQALLPEIRRCQAAGVAVSIVPRMYELVPSRLNVDLLGTFPLLALRAVHVRSWQFSVKYALDRVLAVVLLIVAAPLMGLIALAVRATSPGPAIFRQRRVGLDGRPFDLLKFRSMKAAPPEPLFIPAAGRAPGGVEGVDRRTAVGKLLRRTCLDELPQLINVIRGEMSLVGPRPERPQFADLFASRVARYSDRHRVRAGITGWAQVNGLRGQTSLAERIEYDNYYIENWSFWFDLKILAMTVVAALRTSDVESREPRSVSS